MNESSIRSSSKLAALALLAAFAFAPALPAAAAGLEDFGRCLASKGATFYGASWCPHCRSQQKTLGAAMSKVRYVECSTDGNRGEPAKACQSAGINGYPTWTFADGTRQSGAMSLDELASRTGCELSSAGGKPPAAKGYDSATPRPTGPKIMEIPQSE